MVYVKMDITLAAFVKEDILIRFNPATWVQSISFTRTVSSVVDAVIYTILICSVSFLVS